MDDRPAWARRIRAEREARHWSQTDAVRALQAHSETPLPDKAGLLRNWKRWEAGEAHPDDFYAPLIAKTFGTVTAAMFPIIRDRDTALSAAGLDTLEIVTRLRASTIDSATLDGLRITVDQLCSDYPFLPSAQLLAEGRQWLARITTLLDQRLTLDQHRDVLTLAGWLALLVGCVEEDMGRHSGAEATRQAALSLGQEAGNGDVQAWAHEIRAWTALTQRDYRGVLAAADRGQATAGEHSVAVQLLAQKAKAWARIGDRRQVEVALDQGRAILESLPYPANLAHHFVVDPLKYDFYAMDCYRLLGQDDLASMYAHEVIRASTDPDGHERAPMRISEAQITLGVIAARRGELEQALEYGHQSLQHTRQSIPHLLMTSKEMAAVLQDRHAGNPEARAYLDQLREISRAH
jgi:tetratricopeptide (TPR) repeat protein